MFFLFFHYLFGSIEYFFLGKTKNFYAKPVFEKLINFFSYNSKISLNFHKVFLLLFSINIDKNLIKELNNIEYNFYFIV